MWGLIEELPGYSPEEFRKLNLSALVENIHPENREQIAEIINEAKTKGKRFQEEFRFRKRDGSYIYLEDSRTFLLDEKGHPYRALVMMKDLTERKEAEGALTNFEKARIKDIHHRIKNNLQIVSSLLDLQAEKSGNKETIEKLRESQSRVIAISLIHEELYGSGIDNLDFAAYLRKLTDVLFSSYKPEKNELQLDIDVEETISFDMDTAVPLGVIVNELVSNSLKHAFSGRKDGEIRIKLCREGKHKNTNNKDEAENESSESESGSSSESNSFHLTVSDNGSGFPENIDLENPDSLGLQLVQLLAAQLEGEIEIKRNQGTEFEIRFAGLESQAK